MNPIIARALKRLNAGIAWDSHSQNDMACQTIADRINGYLTNEKINACVDALEIHNWLAENGVQDSAKFNKVQAIVEQIVGPEVSDVLESREQLQVSLFRKIGYSI